MHLFLFAVFVLLIGACAGVDPRADNAKVPTEGADNARATAEADRSAPTNVVAMNQTGNGVSKVLEATSPSDRSPEDEAKSAYMSGDYARAAPLMRPFAEQGQVWAQYGLGTMYEAGKGVPRDEKEALSWYRKAAALGDQRAQTKLAAMNQAVMENEAKAAFAKGDYPRAAVLMRPLAEQGNVDAQTKLGWMYENGKGVPQDHRQAAIWVRKAARQGNTDTQNDPEQLKAACDKGKATACASLGDLYFYGIGVKQDDAQAVALYKRAYNRGDLDGGYALAWMYEHGRGVGKDYREAEALYKKACYERILAGCNNLGMMYEGGIGVLQDFLEAAALFQKACNGGVGLGCNNLGAMVTGNRKACDGGDYLGCNGLGLLYDHGYGVKQDPFEAADLFEKACERRVWQGCHNLSIAYLRGRGRPEDRGNAYKYFEKACTLGSSQSCQDYEDLRKGKLR